MKTVTFSSTASLTIVKGIAYKVEHCAPISQTTFASQQYKNFILHARPDANLYQDTAKSLIQAIVFPLSYIKGFSIGNIVILTIGKSQCGCLVLNK